MPRDRTSRLLDEFTAVTDAAPRPDTGRTQMRNQFPVATLSAASLIVVVVAVAAIVLGRTGPAPAAGASPSPTAASRETTAVASNPVALATSTPSGATCDLAARIVSWEGAAGQRIATVEMTNRGSTDCLVETLPQPQLVDGSGRVLIEGVPTGSGNIMQFAAGAHSTTLVAVGNWCKPEPQSPITIAFVFGGGDRLVAAPLSPTDLTLPPCNGPSQPATITMHPWAQ